MSLNEKLSKKLVVTLANLKTKREGKSIFTVLIFLDAQKLEAYNTRTTTTTMKLSSAVILTCMLPVASVSPNDALYRDL